MKTGILFTLFFLLFSQILLAVPDSISSRKHHMKALLFRIYRGQKGVDRYEISQEFDHYLSKQEFQNAVDFLTEKLSGLDSLENDYKMHTAGYIHGMRGYAQHFLMNHEAALSDANRAIEVVPKWSYGYYIRGEIHYELRDLQAAIDDYTQAIDCKHRRRRKVDLIFYMARGSTYWDLGQIENSLADFNQCIKLDSKWAYPYLRRGSARQALQDQQGAVADYEKAIALEPYLIGGYQSLGWYYFSQNDYDAAIEVISNGLQHIPDSPVLCEMAGSFYLEKGDHPQAITHFTRCIETCGDDIRDPTRLMALIGNSVAYYNTGDKENARNYFDQAANLQPLLYSGIEGMEELKRYCMGWTDKELEILSRMVEEFKNP